MYVCMYKMIFMWHPLTGQVTLKRSRVSALVAPHLEIRDVDDHVAIRGGYRVVHYQAKGVM